MYVDTSDTGAVAAPPLASGARALVVESPTNPLLKIADLAALGALGPGARGALRRGQHFMTPLLQRPLDFGADLAVYSATKYLSGHDDVVARPDRGTGPAAGRAPGLHPERGRAVLGPQDCWLTLRGLKTLGVRLARQQASAQVVAAFLAGHPAVRRVHYPGLPDHPGHQRQKGQAGGFGAMVSFELADASRVADVLSRVGLFLFAESLGGVESLITLPAVQTHADIEPERRARLGVSDGLLRLSVGLNHPGTWWRTWSRSWGAPEPRAALTPLAWQINFIYSINEANANRKAAAVRLPGAGRETPAAGAPGGGKERKTGCG